ncbi:hypothetical protein NITHO_2750002 [Nitrolancea hollandica Lb]|uniref:Uncharacterized protein n=1 Tax=Nitrolancea hollandica Lb TaxID=1129897 RepID=I4EGK4_9BACT|nr:hypothetical protein NITHO_2750002 [Nitrolancea hollandica Lb]
MTAYSAATPGFGTTTWRARSPPISRYPVLGAALGDPEAVGEGLPAADGLPAGLGVAGAGDGDADGAVAVPAVQALKIKRQAEKIKPQIRYRCMKNPSHSPAMA